jgi:hypothetical protein
MNKQELFDKVASHLLKQNKRAATYDGRGACRYRTDDGLMCAAGCLIPDELYDKVGMEGLAVHSMLRATPALCSHLGLPSEPSELMNDERLELLTALQGIHDGCEPEYWPYRLRHIAYDHHLDTAVLHAEVAT